MPQTRVHRWRFDPPHSHQIFLKREDEVRFGMTGGKQRKYASILPWLQAESIETVALIGSANSNNVLSAAILLRENHKKPIPFLKQGRFQGTNQLLLSLLVDPMEWRMIDAKHWPQVEEIAAEVVAACEAEGVKAAYLPEGACMREALPGAMTLAADISRNEQELGFTFNDIFIDAGTGLSAAALLLGFYRLKRKVRVHVTLMADSEEVFLEKFQKYCAWYEDIFEENLPDLADSFTLHKPAFSPSYGSVNAEVIAQIQLYAQQGVFTDPIYSAKHLATVDRYLDNIRDEDKILGLVIHSGGAQSLPGYAHHFLPKS